MVQAPLCQKEFLADAFEACSGETLIDFRVEKVVSLFVGHTSLVVHIKVGFDDLVVEPDHFMRQNLSQWIAHCSDDVAARFQNAIGLAEFLVAL